MSHIFLFANIVDDRINGEHHLGGEGAFASAAIQILKETFKTDVSYTLAGRIGEDESGRFMKRTLENFGVDTSGLTIGETQTCQAIIRGVRKAEFIGFEGGPICCFTQEEANRFSELLQLPGWLFLTSSTLYDDETWAQVHSILQMSPRLLFFDINWREALLKRSGFSFGNFLQERLAPTLKRAHVIKGTREELERFKDHVKGTKAIWILETMGNEGILLRSQEKEFFQEAPKVKEVQDTGAGDTFSGSLLFDLARKKIVGEVDLLALPEREIKMMLRLACQVAAMTVQGFGVDYLSKYRLELLRN